MLVFTRRWFGESGPCAARRITHGGKLLIMTRKLIALLLFGFALGAPLAAPKVVIIGFDGADPRLVERYMEAGHLPELTRLRAEGAYAPLLPTNPPQTPVSWSAFATGTDPGRTQIFDWLERDPATYLPAVNMAAETTRTFLFGERNSLAIGLLAGAAALVVGVLVTSLLRLRWRLRWIVACGLAVVAGAACGAGAGKYLPIEVPDAVNRRQGKTMWQLADEAGLRARVIRVPATFPAEPSSHGRMVSGLGVPDMRGRIGAPAFYTSDPMFDPGDNEFSLELLRLPGRRGRIRTRVVGPLNKPFYGSVVDRAVDAAEPGRRSEVRRETQARLEEEGIERRLDLPLELEVTDTAATVTVGGQSATLSVGEWSEWFEFSFAVNPVVDRLAPLLGIGRFKLLSLEPELQLYLSPINFHPDCHPVAHAWPPDYSEDLKERFGLYKTLGWALDTWSLPSGVGDEHLFLEDMNFTVDKYAEMMRGLLADGDHDLYIQIFYFTDRIGHLFWRHMDEGHPLFEGERSREMQGEMLRAYQRMDALVGEARELAGEDALFLVVSDHGFSSFRRGVNYNNWLVENGFMTLKGQSNDKATLEKLFDTGELFVNVDWSKTKAYALGLGSIYINLAGREKHGIVLPGPEYEEVRRQIKEGMERLVDEETGRRPITRVWLREEMYSDFDRELVPDLRASTDLDYRVSWQTSSAVSPTRRTRPVSSTRRRRACIGGAMSPTSSRNRVPPWAASNRPGCSFDAPLKAPRAWPNSSLSSRLSEKALQFTGTKGASARAPRWWRALATSSLPVPLSPVISTGTSVWTTRSSCRSRSFTAGLVPRISGKPALSPALSRSRASCSAIESESRSSRRRPAARRLKASARVRCRRVKARGAASSSR